jgi:vitamin B12 transporter
MLPSPLLAAALCCAVTGIVHTPNGTPIARAHVALSGSTGGTADSDAGGRFSLTASPGAHAVTVAAPGFVATTIDRIDVHEGTVLDVTLAALRSDALRTIGSVIVDGRLALGRGEVPSQTISRADLDAEGSLRVLDGLAEVPSATITRPLGGNQSAPAVLSLRGPDPSETLVTFDGQVINNANTGDFDFSQVPVSAIAGIDVSEGLGPADNVGANTIGGVVNLRTLAPTTDPHSLFQASYGSFGTTTLGASETGERGRFGYALAAQDYHSQGYVHDYLASVPDASGSLQPVLLGSGISGQSALLNFTWTFTQRADVRVRYLTLANARDESAAQDAPLDATGSATVFGGPGNAFATQGLRAVLLTARAPLGSGSLQGSYSASGVTSNFAGGFSPSPYDLFYNDRIATETLAWQRSTPTFDFSVGGYTRSESLDQGAVFSSDVQREHSDALNVRAGIIAGPRLRFEVSGYDTRYSTFGTSIDGRLGVTYDLDGRSVGRFSVGTGFRAPLLAELYETPLSVLEAGLPGSVDANCVAINGNPNERPEHVTAYELGYGRQLGGSTTIDASVYRTNLRDPIEFFYPLGTKCPVDSKGNPVAAVAGQSIPINIGNVVYQGGALRIARRVGDFFIRAEYGLNVAYPVTLPASVANPTSGANLVAGQQFESIPVQTGTLGLRYVRRGWHADGEITYKGKNNELNDGPYAILDGAVGKTVGAVDYSLALRNLTNAETGRFTLLGRGLPYPVPVSPQFPNGYLPTDRRSLEPVSVNLIVTLRR